MEEKDFECLACGCFVPAFACMRTPGYCYLCDPNITLEELLNHDSDTTKTPQAA